MGSALEPGMLNARLVLERPEETPDGQGGAAVSFIAMASLWAHIEPVAAKADEAAGTLRVTVTHRIRLRWRGDLAGGMRLRKGERLFEIRAFCDPDETRRCLVCDCEEIKP